jgi:serine/threonine-protein kinase
VQGRPLDAVIHDVGRLPILMVQAILAQVADALAYAHRHGVVHRDIKSANIMLDDEGWAVVTDFGIAKVEEAQGLTMTGVTVGTPAYMSPEQCATCEVTGSSDQYSLGVVAYEMLTGHLPFTSNSSMSVMYAHFNATARPVTELRPDCPPNLAAAVMQMLAKEPEDRWPTMDDVVAVCGRPSLRRDDPVRSEMITLAKAGPARLLPNVPTSPIALTKARRRGVKSAPQRARWLWWGVGAAGLAAILWFAAPWRLLLRAPAVTPVDTAAAPPQAALPPTAPVAAETTRGTPPPRQSAARRVFIPLTRTDSAPAVAAAPREDSVVTSLRATAIAAMRRALGAGATPAELASGDTMLRGADSLAAAGRLSEAMVRLVTVTSLWTDAERRAQARARDTAPAVVAALPPAVDPRVAIESVIAAYARALESRDTAQVRRAYPGLTPAQQRQWGDLFKAVRALRASLTPTTVNVTGDAADVIVSGVYEYEYAVTGRLERRPASFRATLASGSGGWRLSAIH